MRIEAETVLDDKQITAITLALGKLGFHADRAYVKRGWTGDTLVIERNYHGDGASITLVLETIEPNIAR